MTELKKKVLILGAGNAQVDAIGYCRNHGYEVVGCAYTTIGRGIPHLDYFEQVDIKNIEGVLSLAQKHQVGVIYSVGSELAMPAVMKVSERLGLPHFTSYETAKVCHSKEKMREALGRDFEGNADFITASYIDEALEYTAFPAMMKPVDSQGQRGCFKVESTKDIRTHFKDSIGFSLNNKVIIEEYIYGPEVSVNVYMRDGIMKFAIVSDRHVFNEYPGGIVKEHRIPSSFANTETRARCVDLARRAAARLGITEGPAYFQIKLKNGVEPVLLEASARLDGCHIWNLIKHYCGADLLDASFRHLFSGESVLDEKYDMPEDEYSLEFMSKKTGTRFKSSEFSVDDAEYVAYYYNDGDMVLRTNGYIEKCGYILRKTGRTVK